MNPRTWTRTITAAAVATISIGGPWAARADAVTDSNGAGCGAAPAAPVAEIAVELATLKAQMAHDHVEHAVARAAYRESAEARGATEALLTND